MRVVSRYAECDCVGPLDDELIFALKVFSHRVMNASPRKVRAGMRKVWHFYTDACFEMGGRAGIGAVLVDEVGMLVEHFSEFLNERSTETFYHHCRVRDVSSVGWPFCFS